MIYCFLFVIVFIQGLNYPLLARKDASSVKSTPAVMTRNPHPKKSLAPEDPVKPEIPCSTIPLDLEILAPQVILMDYETGTILLQKNASQPVHPSSMTKIMTAYLIFEKLKAGALKPDTLLTVTQEGWRVEGSSMFLNIGDQVTVMDLLKGLIIQSGNDASVILALNIAGSEKSFALEMTKRAQELGATHTTFVNASGLPHEQHLTTAQDLAILSRQLIHDFPEHYPLFAEKEFTYKNITQGNRNPLLYTNIGALCDGIKTGSSTVGGFGMVASCLQDDLRLILVMNGLNSMQSRADEARKIMSWGLRTFANYVLFKKQELIQDIPVWFGQEKKLPLTVEHDVILTLARISRPNIRITIRYPSCIKAPIQKGTPVGQIIINAPTMPKPLEIPLIAATSIEKTGFMGSVYDSFTYLIKGQKG